MLSVTIKKGVIDQRTLLSTRAKKISFNGYFYKPEPMRILEEIRADFLEIEKETEGLLEEMIVGVGND